MDLVTAVNAATRAAATVTAALDEVEVEMDGDDLAAFLLAHPNASAEVLWRHQHRRRGALPPFVAQPAALRVAFEVFRATFLVLHREILAQAAALAAAAEAPSAGPLADRGIGKRAMRKRPGLRTRVVYGRPAAPQTEPDGDKPKRRARRKG